MAAILSFSPVISLFHQNMIMKEVEKGECKVAVSQKDYSEPPLNFNMSCVGHMSYIFDTVSTCMTSSFFLGYFKYMFKVTKEILCLHFNCF